MFKHFFCLILYTVNGWQYFDSNKFFQILNKKANYLKHIQQLTHKTAFLFVSFLYHTFLFYTGLIFDKYAY